VRIRPVSAFIRELKASMFLKYPGHRGYCKAVAVADHLKEQHGKRRLKTAVIRDAIRTVRVLPAGNEWAVKKVAKPEVWRFETRPQAIEWAQKVARGSYDVVIHDRSGRVTKTLSSRFRAKGVGG
jgi:hypothetical protein